jgi:hypothetical protein
MSVLPGLRGKGYNHAESLPRLANREKYLAINLDGSVAHGNEEVIQHLSGIIGSEETSEKLVRDVTENCPTLRFSNYGFEES